MTGKWIYPVMCMQHIVWSLISGRLFDKMWFYLGIFKFLFLVRTNCVWKLHKKKKQWKIKEKKNKKYTEKISF